MQLRDLFCDFGAIGLRDDRLCTFALDGDAIAEGAEKCIGNAVGLIVAAEMRGEKPELGECIAHGDFKRSRIIAGGGCGEAIAKGLRLCCIRWCDLRREIGPIVGWFVDAKIALLILDDRGFAAATDGTGDVFDECAVDVFSQRRVGDEATFDG